MTERITLIHWKKPAEAEERAERLRAAGFAVRTWMEATNLRALREDPPDAIVISLDRLPSHGRAIAAELRRSPSTRYVPLVFVGEAKRIDDARAVFPDAAFASWETAAAAVRQAIDDPPDDPIVYRDSITTPNPLWKKLGIKEDSRVGFFDAPPDFEATLGELPAGAVTTRSPDLDCDVTIWFVTALDELLGGIEAMGAFAGPGKRFWIAWPKKSSGVVSDVADSAVRETGVAAGLVDYKVCAIDETWSGYCFAPRRD